MSNNLDFCPRPCIIPGMDSTTPPVGDKVRDLPGRSYAAPQNGCPQPFPRARPRGRSNRAASGTRRPGRARVSGGGRLVHPRLVAELAHPRLVVLEVHAPTALAVAPLARASCEG